MSQYRTVTPTFNPISLQEYLAVPQMIQKEYDIYEEKYNENLDKLAVLEGMLDESTKDYLNGYKENLNNAADMISGKTGNLTDLRRQVNAARQFYREYAPKLTAAYTRRQEDLKAQRELELKDPSAITTRIGNMQSYLDNPDQRFYNLSGDKIYADMINAGKLAAADISNESYGNPGKTGYFSQIKRLGYTLKEQQQYANLVQQALYGSTPEDRVAADQALKSNAIFAQPYQVLSKYIEDNRFNAFDDQQQNYAINRALSGQLMGMTNSTDTKLIADKQWEHNSRVAAAKTGKEPSVRKPSLIKPVARVASFGDKTLNDRSGNIYQTTQDGTVKLKSKDDFVAAIGGAITPERMTSVQRQKINNIIDDIITADGRLITPAELEKLIKESKTKGVGRVSGSNIINSDVVQYYRNMYEQLQTAGVDVTKSYAPISIGGNAIHPTMEVNFDDKQAIFNNFWNEANTIIGTDPLRTNAGFYTEQIPIANDDISPWMAALPEKFQKFTGMTKDDHGNLTYRRNGKAVKKADIIKQAQTHGASLERNPIDGGYIVIINNKDSDKYYIKGEDFDNTVHNYNQIDYRRYDATMTSIRQELQQVQIALQTDPNNQELINYYNQLQETLNYYQNQLNTELYELEQGILGSNAFTSIKPYNPNITSFRE